MQKHRWHHAAGLLIITLLVSGCASMPRHDPLQVSVAGIEPLAGEGMEVRLLVKLRVQNPNDTPVELSSKLSGASFFGTQRFTSKGEFALPQGGPATVTAR